MKNIKRVAAVHDMSGFGKCSLTVALPVISACGVEVCPLPTALLSTNTQFKGFTFLDCTDNMSPYIAHWKSVNLHLDAVYSGFLGSAQQIDYILNIAKSFAVKYIIVDPVMGDNGVIYSTYTKELCDGMRNLVASADIVTPNITEACELTKTNYATCDQSTSGIQNLCEKINEIGAKAVVITGIERANKMYNCVYENGVYKELEIDALPFRMHGTGDLFTSVLTGSLLTDHSITESVNKAAKFVVEAMQFSQDVEGVHERGVCFEPLLYKLANK